MVRKLYPGEVNGFKKADLMWGHPVDELIQHRGYGSTRPLPEYADGGNHEENRRVEMRLLEVQTGNPTLSHVHVHGHMDVDVYACAHVHAHAHGP